MKKEELMIGNYFVAAHESNAPVLKIDKFYNNGCIANNGLKYPFDFMIPILLKEEWLISFGFEFYSLGDDVFEQRWRKDDFDIIWQHSDGFICESVHSEIELKYIHQLQNIFFWLNDGKILIKQ